MASPIAHTLAGATVCLWSVERGRFREVLRRHWRLMVLFAVLANLPDGDFVFGWLTSGDPNQYHHGWTHSIPVAAAAALLTALAIKFRPSFAANWAWFFAAVDSHLFIDYFTGSQLGFHESYGMPLFWPFTGETSQGPISLVVGPKHHAIAHLFSVHNWMWGAYELAVFGSLLLVTIGLRSRRHDPAIHTDPRR